jgi:hypothetical protein
VRERERGGEKKVSFCRSCSTAREPAANHVAGNVTRQVARAKGASGQVGGLAELVASGEGERVHDCQDKRNDNKRQPEELQPHHSQNSHDNPQHRLHIQRKPEEAAVRRVDDFRGGIAALKHPFGVARGRVDLVPPSETDEATAGNVLEVVEVGGEEEDGDDKDHDHAIEDPETKEVDEYTGYSEGEESQKCDGMRAQAPTEITSTTALQWLRSLHSIRVHSERACVVVAVDILVARTRRCNEETAKMSHAW